MEDEGTIDLKEKAIAEIENILNQIIESEIPEEKLLEQMGIFNKGLPFVKLNRPCIIADGITKIQESDFDTLLKLHSRVSNDSRIMKFVPASGAATRMFKDLITTFNNRQIMSLEQNLSKEIDYTIEFIKNIKKFSFYEVLNNKLSELGYDADNIISSGNFRIILDLLLFDKGLNYSLLPKGLIPFHRYTDEIRTPFYEHLIEALDYSADNNKRARVHFTVAKEFFDEIENHLYEITQYLKNKGSFDISLTIQKKSTNTIAVDMNNEILLDDENNLIFRPGGHGALIENLNELNGDLVYIKNIDNIQTDDLKETTILYKKLLGGFLVQTQDKIFEFLVGLHSGNYSSSLFSEIAEFSKNILSINTGDDYEYKSINEKAEFWKKCLDKPLRVCGMVRNSGEPGGGPFWVEDISGELSLQIVESAQIDLNNVEQKLIFNSSTHFNPVDLVCGLRDYKGNPYDLNKFIDIKMSFITIKSVGSKEIKAYELPGLWNGSMAYWNTVFIEVPDTTFTPVKTVNDLLKKEHLQT